jgi:hypothetical protein
MNFTFPPLERRLFLILLAIDSALLILHFIFGLGFSLDLLHLDRERNIPSYYSGLKLISVAMLAFSILLLSLRKVRFFWGVFTLIFIALSFDEISELHENVTYYVLKLLSLPLPGFFRSPTHNWLFLFSPFIVGILAFFFYSIRKVRDLGDTPRRLLMLGFLFFAFALFLEFFGGVIRTPVYFRTLAALEEYVEMIGATCVLTALYSIARIRFIRTYHRIDQCKTIQ